METQGDGGTFPALEREMMDNMQHQLQLLTQVRYQTNQIVQSYFVKKRKYIAKYFSNTEELMRITAIATWHY